MARNALLFAFAIVVGIPTLVSAQTGTGSLTGYIKDEQGAVLPGVTVTATSPALIKPVVAVSERTGYYRVINLPPGTFTLTAELSGFAIYKREGILLRGGANYTVDIVLKLGALSETVTVSGESPMIETTLPSNVLNISGDFQKQMPLQARRNWTDFLELTPGVLARPNDDGSGRMVYLGHAADIWSHVTQLEGMIASNYQDAQPTWISMGADMISDVQVKTGGVEASAPMGTGLVINVVTKSGGDQFKGSAGFQYQPFAWNGNNTRTVGNFSGTPTTSQVHQLDAGLGGPIKRASIWFFTAVRRASIENGISRTSDNVGNLKAFYPSITLFNNNSQNWLPYVKITAQLSSNHQLAGYYQHDRVMATGDREDYFTPNNVRANGGSLYGAKLTSVWGKSLTTTLIGSYNNKGGANADTYKGRLGTGPYVIIHQNAFLQGGRVVGTGPLVEGGNLHGGVMALQPASLLDLRGDLTYFVEGWAGSHQIQTGFFAERGQVDTESQYINDGYILEESRQIDPSDPSKGTQPFHRQYVTPLDLKVRAAREQDIGIYVQDSWKPVPRLTANLGIRSDFVRRFDDIFQVTRQRSREIEPRLGFSYLVTEDAKNVLRGTYVRTPEQMNGRDAVTTFGATSRVATRNEYSLDGFQTIASVITTQAINAKLSGYQIDPTLHQPFVDEFIVGFRRQLPGNLSVDVSAIKRAYKDTWALTDVNGLYPAGPNQPFLGFGRVDPNQGIIYQQTNNHWSRLNYTAIEITAAKNLSHGFQFMAGFNRQWQHFSGTWNPTDPARFIQPSAFPSNELLYQPRGDNEQNSLPLQTGTNTLTYGPSWQKYQGDFGATWLAPLGLVVAGSFTVIAGPWSGPIVDLLLANDPQLAVFGPATFVLPNGTRVSNPLSTRLRFVFPTRGDQQVQAPTIKTLGLKIGKLFKIGGSREVEVAGNVFNLLNGGDFTQYNYNGADERFNAKNFLQMRNQQPARSFQFTAVFRF